MSPTATGKLKPPVGANDHVQGPADAPVTLVEYGDYECPYCGEAYPVVKALQKRLGGQLRFAFRNFPLSQAHPHAEHAAEAAEAAGAQGKFWQMHDMLYENQDALDPEDLVRCAQALRLDVPRFAREIAKHLYAERVREDFSSGVRSGVNGTPTFFINGVRHDGPFDLGSLLAAIEEAA
jgi:protein-disulfide isomerase